MSRDGRHTTDGDAAGAEGGCGEPARGCGSEPATYRRLAVDGVADDPDPDRVKQVLDEAVGGSPYEFDLREAAPGERVTPPPGRHDGAAELLFVLAGALSVETGTERLRFEPNEAVLVPSNAPTRPVVAGAEPCRFLALGAP